MTTDYFQHASDFMAEVNFLGAYALDTINPFPELTAADFANTTHAALYKAFEAGDFAPDATNLARYGVPADIWCGVLESTGSSAQGAYHGRKVKALAMRRRAIKSRLKELELLADPAADTEAIDAIVGAAETSSKVKTAAQMAEEASAQYGAMKHGFTCDIAHIRNVLGLSAPGDHIVVACASSVGKSSLGLQICEHYRTLFVSGEMPAVNIARRAHAMEYWRMAETEAAGILANEKDQNRDFHALMKAERAQQMFRDHWLYITDPVSVPELDGVLAASDPMEMVLVDYLQLMKGSGEDRRNQMASLARGMKQLAKKHGVRIVSLCQVSRPMMGGAATDPATIPVTLARLKETGDIEESADYVLGMWLHRSRETEIQVLQDIKNRNAGVHPAAYLKRVGPWFRDAEYAEVEACDQEPAFSTGNSKAGVRWVPE